jgi:hypothetical protein
MTKKQKRSSRQWARYRGNAKRVQTGHALSLLPWANPSNLGMRGPVGNPLGIFAAMAASIGSMKSSRSQ